jgi:chitinase
MPIFSVQKPNDMFPLKSDSQKKMVCYYGTWAVYRPGNGKFDVEDIDTNLCTHIIYGFTGLGTDNTIKCLDPWNDLYDGGGKGALYRFTGLKSRNPSMKALVAIGIVSKCNQVAENESLYFFF